MNSAERYNYNYNRRAVERRIKKLRAVALGTNISILPYICKADGEFSTKKAFDFIKKLLDCGEKLGPEEMKLYRDFFYCTFRCFANERIMDYEVYEQFRPCETFQDVLDKALLVDADKWIKEKEILFNYEYQELENIAVAEMNSSNGFFITMDICYHRVTGEGLEAIDGEGLREYKKGRLYEEYEKRLQEACAEVDECDAKEKEEFAKEMGFESYEECEKALNKQGYKDMDDYLDKTRFDDLTDEELADLIDEAKDSDDMYKYINELNDVREPLWKNYADSFADVQEFADRYREYRQLFFEVDHSSFYDKVENIIFNYLFEHRLSVFTSDDATFGEFAILDEMEARLDTAIRRVRRKYGLFK